MIWPDWQYPHCTTSRRVHASCTARAILPRRPFDRRDLPALGGGHGHRARPDGLPVDVHRAGAALRGATAVLGAGEAELFPQNPEQRCVGLGGHLHRPAIDVEHRHDVTSRSRLPLIAGREAVPQPRQAARARTSTGAARSTPIPTIRCAHRAEVWALQHRVRARPGHPIEGTFELAGVPNRHRLHRELERRSGGLERGHGGVRCYLQGLSCLHALIRHVWPMSPPSQPGKGQSAMILGSTMTSMNTSNKGMVSKFSNL